MITLYYRFAHEVAAGDELLVQENNQFAPAEVLKVTSLLNKGTFNVI